jgi:hypothetical protein
MGVRFALVVVATAAVGVGGVAWAANQGQTVNASPQSPGVAPTPEPSPASFRDWYESQGITEAERPDWLDIQTPTPPSTTVTKKPKARVKTRICVGRTGNIVTIAPQCPPGTRNDPRAASRKTKPSTAIPWVPTAPSAGDATTSGCTPGYSPCLPPPGDYDCEGGGGNGPYFTGRVEVTGPDIYRLDADDNGIGCQ